MNKQLFLAKNVPHNTKSNANLLVDGELGVFGTNDSTYIVEKVAGGSTYENFFISLGTAVLGSPRHSRPIDVLPSARLFEYKKFSYSPFVAKVFLVSIDCTGTNGAYDSMALRISDRGGDDESGQVWGANTYIATGKFATAREVYDAWAQAIADKGIATSRVTAVATDAGIQITPQFWDEDIHIGVEYYNEPLGIWCATCETCDATVAVQNEGDSGSGHLWHLNHLAKESAAYIGAAYYNDRLITNPGATLDASVAAFGNADILYIKWKNRNQANGDHGKVFDMYQELFLAFPTGSDTGAIESVINQLISKTPKPSLV